MRLRVHRTLHGEAEEFQLDIEASEGLELLKFQVASITGLELHELVLLWGEAGHELRDDLDLEALLPPKGSEHADDYVSVVRAADVRDAWKGTCTRVLLGERDSVQSAYVIPGSEKLVCYACAQLCFAPGLLASRVGPLQAFQCAAVDLCAEGLGHYQFQSRVAEATEAPEVEEGKQPPPPPVPVLALLNGLREAAYTQQATGFNPQGQEAHAMAARLHSGCETVRIYEQANLQAQALEVMPLSDLHDRAIAKGGDPQRDRAHFRDLLFRELLHWFKHEFFRWVNQPPCDQCGKGTSLEGGAAPTPEEVAGRAGRVEVYKCNEGACGRRTRFPRYNDPGKLLQTRRGRCGEWANAFTLCCRAAGFEARYVLDWTDHVWTEYFSEAENRWVHADSCENRADHPMMYESGWGKKLTYVIAFSKEGVADVSRRYTRKLNEVLARRNEVPEAILRHQVTKLDHHLRSTHLSSASSAATAIPAADAAARSKELDLRARREAYELTHNSTIGGPPRKVGETQGRISGDAAWKRARGEDGARVANPRLRGHQQQQQQKQQDQLAMTDVPPPPPGGVSTDVAGEEEEGILERAEVAGLCVGSVTSGGAPSAIICVASGVDKDPTPLGISRYRKDAITINGFPVATGLRGCNMVVFDPSTGRVERSVCFSGPCDPMIAEPAVYDAMARFIHGVGQGQVLIAAVLGAGQVQGAQVSLSPSVVFGGRDGAFAAVCIVGHTAEWEVKAFSAEGRGPVTVVARVPLGAAVAESVEDLSDTVISRPLWHDMGPQGDGVVDDPEVTFQQLQQKFNAVRGYSYKPGGGMAIGGAGAGFDKGFGWTTKLHTPAATASAAVDMKELVKAKFAEVVKGGLPPTQAAAKALLLAKEEVSQPMPAQSLECMDHVGQHHRHSRMFDDTELALPHSAITISGEYFAPRKLRSLKVWTSGPYVQGLQAGYHDGKELHWGPLHRGSEGDSREGETLELQDGERIAVVEIRAGNLIDRLVVVTSTGRRVIWGGPGGEPHIFIIPQGHELAAFNGAVGGHLHTLGLVRGKGLSSESVNGHSHPSPLHLWGVYTTSAVDRAVRVMVLGADAPASVVVALKAARRYVANCQGDVTNAKFRTIRCSRKFFSDNVGRHPGSGLLMAALGFEHAVTAEGSEFCYELPIGRSSRRWLDVVAEELDKNIARLDGL